MVDARIGSQSSSHSLMGEGSGVQPLWSVKIRSWISLALRSVARIVSFIVCRALFMVVAGFSLSRGREPFSRLWVSSSAECVAAAMEGRVWFFFCCVGSMPKSILSAYFWINCCGVSGIVAW